MVSGLDQSSELSVLDSDVMEVYLLILPKDIGQNWLYN